MLAFQSVMAHLVKLTGLTSTSELSEVHIHWVCLWGISRKDQLRGGSALRVGCTVPKSEGLNDVTERERARNFSLLPAQLQHALPVKTNLHC